MDKPIVMGRKTFESIGKPLPGRQNIVLSRNPEAKYEGVDCVGSFSRAVSLVGDVEEIMVIGGSAVYEMLLPEVDRMYLTYVEAEFSGDAWFPKFDKNQWLEIEAVKRPADKKNLYDCRFVTLQKK
jgi:dihydrofolate reductase